jgi:uncharacterized integral membrane protein
VTDGTESGFDVQIRKQPMKRAVEKCVNSGVALYVKFTWMMMMMIIIIIIIIIIIYYSELTEVELVFKDYQSLTKYFLSLTLPKRF